MGVASERAAGETETLRRTINDLASTLVLPAPSSGGEPAQIVDTLLDSLIGMLRLDFVYVRLSSEVGDLPVEMVRVAGTQGSPTRAREIGEILTDCLGDDSRYWPSVLRTNLGSGDISFVPLRLGLHGQAGLIVAGSQRADFPQQTESLLLSAAVDQASVGLHEAQLLGKQKPDTDARQLEHWKRADEAIRASERNLDQLIDTIPALAWSARASDGSADFFNKHYLDFVGLTTEQAHGWGWAVAVHPDDLNALVAAWKVILASGKQGEAEARLRRRDGEYRWFLFRANPLHDENGNVVKWYGVNTDIQDRKQSEDGFRAIIETTPECVKVVARDGTVLRVNAAGAAIAGVPSPDLVVGQNFYDFLAPEHRDRYREFHEKICSGEKGFLEFDVISAQGARLHMETHAAPLRDHDGSVVQLGVTRDITARKHAEEKLRQSELAARLVVDCIPGLVVTLTPEGGLELVNPQLRAYCGQTLDALKDWTTSGVIHPDQLTAAIEAITSSLRTGDPYELEYRLRRYDGVYRWFQARGLPLRDTDGHILRWYILLTDIEDRKQAEIQLAGEKRLLEMIASGSPLREVLEAVCRFVESAAADWYCGIYPIDWSGPSFQYGVAPSLPDTYTEPIAGLPVHYDTAPCGIAALDKVQVIAADIESDPRWYTSSYRSHVLRHGLRSIWSTPICSLEGQRVLGTFCIYQNKPATPSAQAQELIAHVTQIVSIAIERSRADASLRRSETLLADGQRLSMTGTFAWRLDTDEITFSEELYRIFELEPSVPLTLELIGSRIFPDDLPLVSEKIVQARGDSGDVDYEIRLRMPDERIKYLRIVGHVVCQPDGRRERFGAMQDITQRRLSDEALDKARSELAHVTRVMSLGTMTASIAHEVNQPLSGIITNASTCLRMLGAEPPNIDGARETARRMIRDGNRATDVIARLRALFAKKHVAAEALDINEAAREVIALSMNELKRNRVIVQQELAAQLPPVTGDRVQLQQVILNLLLNASEAMQSVAGRTRELQIKTELAEPQQVRVSVRDAGVGFEAQAAEQLFEAFYTTKAGGMGIGLSISRSIVENHRGRLWAAPNDGPGATFSFSIPCGTEASISERS